MLSTLQAQGIRSLMVEGGATVIKSFLSAAGESSGLVDAVVVTVAPIFVGSDGVGYGQDLLASQVRI